MYGNGYEYGNGNGCGLRWWFLTILKRIKNGIIKISKNV